MRYTISIDYSSGDSNSQWDSHNDVGITWANLDVAKTALKRIAVHNECYQKSNRWDSTEKDRKAFEQVPGYNGYFSISLPLDDGTEHSTQAFWQGYFERLKSAEIIPVLEEEHQNDMKYTPK